MLFFNRFLVVKKSFFQKKFCRNIILQKIWAKQNFVFKKCLCPKKFWIQKQFGPKQVLGSKKFLVQKSLVSKRVLGPKKYRVQKNFGLPKIFGQTNFGLGPKIKIKYFGNASFLS